MPIVVWNKSAEDSLRKAYQNIKKDSPKNAKKVLDEILSNTSRLVEYPEKYPPDKYKKDNPGNYRAFENVFLTHSISMF